MTILYASDMCMTLPKKCHMPEAWTMVAISVPTATSPRTRTERSLPRSFQATRPTRASTSRAATAPATNDGTG